MTVTADVLPKLHTKVLLKALQQTRARNSSEVRLIDHILEIRGMARGPVSADEMDDARLFVDAIWLGGAWQERSTVTVEQLKAELAKREHVPNKQESIALRKAKQLRNRQKGRKDR